MISLQKCVTFSLYLGGDIFCIIYNSNILSKYLRLNSAFIMRELELFTVQGWYFWNTYSRTSHNMAWVWKKLPPLYIFEHWRKLSKKNKILFHYFVGVCWLPNKSVLMLISSPSRTWRYYKRSLFTMKVQKFHDIYFRSWVPWCK